MATRKIKNLVRGHAAVDGAGVKLVRVLGIRTVKDFDPFLMLDAFDSRDPADYIAGFPLHPHRGIETITYLIHGSIRHKDSLGHVGTIHAGEAQWMTAGRGILHEEMPQESPRLFGLQTWLNLPASEKMAEPLYFDINHDMMRQTREGDAEVLVVAGDYKGTRGVTPHHIQAEMYDIRIPAGKEVAIPTKDGHNVFVFLIAGDAIIDGRQVAERTAVLFGEGDAVSIQAPPNGESRFMFFSGKPLHEPVAWGGPIVMNTESELSRAFEELENGTFIKR